MKKKAKSKKKYYRDYYKEIGKPIKIIKRRPIKFSKVTEKKLKVIARRWNASVNYVIVKLLTEALDTFDANKESVIGDLVLTIVSGNTQDTEKTVEDPRENLKRLREF